jgi:hypothetical protein
MPNESQGPVLIGAISVADINEALRQLVDRTDYLMGLRGPVDISDRAAASDPRDDGDLVTLRYALTLVPISRRVDTTAPLTGGGALTADLTLAIPAASETTDGYLAAADFVRFASWRRHFMLMGA